MSCIFRAELELQLLRGEGAGRTLKKPNQLPFCEFKRVSFNFVHCLH